MKYALLAALVFAASPALAAPEDDYLACLVGKAMIEIHSRRLNDPLGAASKLCPEPLGIDPEEGEVIGDVANMAVDALVAAFK